jgi:peptidyl-prolyl cis-trans isomerase SurA
MPAAGGGAGVRGRRRAGLAGLLALAAAGGAAAGELVDGVAAQVGGEIVLVSEVQQLAAPLERELRARGAPEAEIERLRAAVLDRLIERRLIQLVVRRAELAASDAEVDAAIESIARENRLSTEELRASVEEQGLPFPAYRERIRGEIEHAKVLNGMIASGVQVEDDEVRALYERRFAEQPRGGEEVHLRQLLVAFEADTPEAREAACGAVEGARRRIEAGESFEAVAREASQVNPERGGDVGWVHVETLAPWMREAVDALAPGETSGVLRPDFGCSLLELVERRGWEPVSYEQARERLRAELFEQRLQEEYVEFVDKMREQTYVERKGVFAETATPPPPAAEPTGP